MPAPRQQSVVADSDDMMDEKHSSARQPLSQSLLEQVVRTGSASSSSSRSETSMSDSNRSHNNSVPSTSSADERKVLSSLLDCQSHGICANYCIVASAACLRQSQDRALPVLCGATQGWGSGPASSCPGCVDSGREEGQAHLCPRMPARVAADADRSLD
jgi:hypothetical protein